MITLKKILLKYGYKLGYEGVMQNFQSDRCKIFEGTVQKSPQNNQTGRTEVKNRRDGCPGHFLFAIQFLFFFFFKGKRLIKGKQ